MGELVRFGVSVENTLLKSFDNLIQEKGYASRSEAFRDLIRDMLVRNSWKADTAAEHVATVTLVYNHEVRDLSDKLTEIQHQNHKAVVSTLHVHLSKHSCLEVLVLRGKAEEIRKTADRLIATKGVSHGTFTMATTGEGF
jgi:CopG family transcriptional regulator, nickel-responsive regulator